MTSSEAPSDAKKEKRICLGKITSPHGVKGLVKIFPYGENPDLIETLSPLFTSETGNKTLSITLKNALGKYILAEVHDNNTREAAELLKGTELWVSREKLPDINNDDEYYIEDLTNLAVFDHDTQKHIATLRSIQNYGAGDLLELGPLTGGQTFFVPFQNEYVISIDLEQKTIVLKDVERFKFE